MNTDTKTKNLYAANSQWGYVNGLTRLSQECKFQDERNVIDLAASKVLQMSF